MWARIINAALGIWLTASPSVLDFGGAAKTNSVVCGALAASFAVIAVWEVTRGLRRLNLLIGVWLLPAGLIFGFGVEATMNTIAVGILIIILSLFRGSIKQQTGGGWTALFISQEGTNKNLSKTS